MKTAVSIPTFVALDDDDLETDAEFVRDIFVARGRTKAHMMAVFGVLMGALLETAPKQLRAALFEDWCKAMWLEVE